MCMNIITEYIISTLIHDDLVWTINLLLMYVCTCMRINVKKITVFRLICLHIRRTRYSAPCPPSWARLQRRQKRWVGVDVSFVPSLGAHWSRSYHRWDLWESWMRVRSRDDVRTSIQRPASHPDWGGLQGWGEPQNLGPTPCCRRPEAQTLDDVGVLPTTTKAGRI